MLTMRPGQLIPILQFIEQFKARNPNANKASVEAAIGREFEIVKERSVYRVIDGAFRLSEANTPSFSNTVLSLSALRKYDAKPFMVVVIKPEGVDFLLANTSFLRKISHSSHQLRVDNVKGSFLGHDILREFDGRPNNLANFDLLFELHRDIPWEDNLLRLVEATTAIVPVGRRFDPSSTETANILSSPVLAEALHSSIDCQAVGRRLADLVQRKAADVLSAASIENVNLRGNSIEQILTESGNLHSLHDLLFPLPGGSRLTVDIKTKLLDRASSPKLYNVDKTLRLLSTGNDAFALLLVGIDIPGHNVQARFVSIFDHVVLNATRVQFHWAGRASRGVTQLTGEMSQCFRENWISRIDIPLAQAKLREFLDL